MDRYLFKDGEEIKKCVGISESIPAMGGSAQGGIVLSASSATSGYPVWKAFDKDSATGWVSSGKPSISSPEWIQIDFGEEVSVEKYSFTNSPSTIANPYIETKVFELKGSTDAATWVTLHSKANESWSYSSERKEYELPSNERFRYYRIIITSSVQNASTLTLAVIGEIDFFVKNETWESIESAVVAKELFDLHGMTDLSLINSQAMQQLNSDQVELLCWTDEENPARQVGITGLPSYAILASSNDIPLEEAEKITLSSNRGTGALIQIAVSSDEGVTWKGKSSLTMSDLSSVKANGFTPEELNALTKEQLATLFPDGTARFAFYLEQENLTDVVEIQSLLIGEKQYTISPTATDLSLIYEVLQEEKPTLYASRDDGVSWKEISQDEMASLSEQPEGNSLRVKAVLKNGQEIHAMSYAWA